MEFEEQVKPVPRLELAQWRFELEHAKQLEGLDVETTKQKMMDLVKQETMYPFYTELCAQMGWPVDEGLAGELRAACEKKLADLDAKIEEAEKGLGDAEIREPMQEKADHFAMIGDKANALEMYRKTFEKTVALGHRLDIVFALIRLGLFYMDHDLVVRNIEKAKSLIEEGGDWDRRNRLKVYEGLYLMSIRNFKAAANLFLDTVSTFTSTELLPYKTFVSYAVYCSVYALNRVELGKKVINSPEMIEVAQEIPIIRTFIKSLYDCNYSEFFRALAEVEGILKADRYWHAHYRFYTREMRIVAYTQLLESYRSVTMASMATSFGVSENFVDRELSRFIAGGRLSCRIDKVNGVVETNRHDSKTAQYHSMIKQGDLLLNRVQKLSRVINI